MAGKKARGRRGAKGEGTMTQPVVGAVERRLVRPGLSSTAPRDARDPSLDELLDDPIRLLLWRGDGLEPSQARGEIRDLLASVRRSRSARNGSIEAKRSRRRRTAGLAA
jgi:hypothetical protein